MPSPTLGKIFFYLRWAAYTLAGGAALLFCFANMQTVALTLFPLPYSMEIPLFLFAILLFATGLLSGYALHYFSHRRTLRALKHSKTRSEALENELAGMKDDQQAIAISYSSQHSNV